MSYSDRKEGNWDYQRISGQLKAQEKAQKEAIKAAEKAAKKAAKSSRRSYSAPKNLTVDQVMADYNSWNAKQPQTAEQVMADFNAWNTDADAWMQSQTPVQTSAQGSSRRVVPMDTFTPFNQGKQDKKEEQGATRVHYDPTKQERPDPSAITKGKEIPQLEITDPSSAYNKVVDYKEELRKIDKEKERQQELREKNKAVRLEKQAERAERSKARKDWTTSVVPELKKDYGTGIMGIGREYADQVNKLQKSAYGDMTDRELAELKKEYDSNTHFGLKTNEQRLLDREIDQRKKAKKEEKYGTGLEAIWNESLDNAEKNYAKRVEDYQKAAREYQKVSALTDPSAMYRETPEQRAARNDAMLNLYAAANGYSLEGAKEDLQEQNDKALVQQWLDPSYKMSDDERARARRIVEQYWDDPEWNQDDLSKLSAKENTFVSGAVSFAKPIYNAAHFVGNVVDDVVGTGLEMGAELVDAIPGIDGAAQAVRDARADYQNMTGGWANQMDTAAENASTQHPIASGVGNFAGQAAMYALTNPAFDAIAGVGNLGLAGTAALEQAGQNLQDLLLDTLPEYERNIRNGMSQDEAIRQAFETQGYNALGNLAIPIIGDLYSGGKKAITNYFKNANTPDPEYLSELRKYRQNVLDPLAADADNIAKAARTTDLSPLETAAKNVDVDNLATAGRQTVNNLDELAEQATKQVPTEPVKSIAPEASTVEEVAEQAAKTDVAPNGLRYPEQDNPIIDSIETARKGMEEGIPKAKGQLDTHQMQVDNVLSKYDFNANEETKVLLDAVQDDYKTYRKVIQVGDTEAADAAAKKLRSDLGKLHRRAEKYVPDYKGELNIRDITQGSNYPAYSIRNMKNAKIDADSVMNNWNNSFLASEFGEMTREQYDAFLKEAQDLGWVDELGNPTKEALGSIPSSEYDDILSQYDDIVKNALEHGNTEIDTAASILDSLEKEQKAGRVYLDDKEWYDMVGAANDYARTGERQYLEQMNDIISGKRAVEPPVNTAPLKTEPVNNVPVQTERITPLPRAVSETTPKAGKPYEEPVGLDSPDGTRISSFRTNTAEKQGWGDNMPVEESRYSVFGEKAQHAAAYERYKNDPDLKELFTKDISQMDEVDIKAAMDKATELMNKGDIESIRRGNQLAQKIGATTRRSGRIDQALVEYDKNTVTGALRDAASVREDVIESWGKNHKQAKEGNARIAKALSEMGHKVDAKDAPILTHEQIKNGVKAELEKEFASISDQFTDTDWEYLTRLAEDKSVPVWKITDELEHRLKHGMWYTLDESLPQKVVKNHSLERMLDEVMQGGQVAAKEKPEQTIGNLLTGIKNTLNDDASSVAGLFDDDDYYFIAQMMQEGTPRWQIVEELRHRLEHGEWFPLSEEVLYKKPTNQKLQNALNSLVTEKVRVEKPAPTFDQLRKEVRNTLEKEAASVGLDFTDADVEYLANLINNGASGSELADALSMKLATGSFGLTDEQLKEVNDIFKWISNFNPSSKRFVEGQARAYEILADALLPNATAMEKFEAWRYLAMLGNPKTMLRNYVGNKTFQGVTGMSNTVAAIAEAGVDKVSKFFGGNGIQRTKSVLNPVSDSGLIKASSADAELSAYRQLSGSKYEKFDANTMRQNKSVFESKPAQLYEKMVDAGISDYPAAKSKYSTSLAGYLKANGYGEEIFKAEDELKQLTELSETRLLNSAEQAQLDQLTKDVKKLNDAREYAIKQAEYATFHEDNKFASTLSSMSKLSKEKGTGIGHVLIEGMVPFKKTPANVLRSGYDYSILSLYSDIQDTLKLIWENTGSRKGNLEDVYKNIFGKEATRKTAAGVIDRWSKTFTGSILTALGFYLHNKGLLHLSDDATQYQDQLEGHQNYGLEINGHSYTLDWAAPSIMPLMMGAEISKLWSSTGKDDEDFYSNLDEYLAAANRIVNPLIDTSMLSGVKDTLETAASAAQNQSNVLDLPMTLGYNVATGYATQAVPTLAGQIARTIDPVRRSTYTDKEGVAGVLDKQLKKQMNKIPFLSMLNNEYVDTYGRTQNNSPFDNPLLNLGYQMLSPGYYSKINETDADRMSREAYETTKESKGSMLPAWQPKLEINEKRVDPDTYTEYAKTYGTTQKEIRDTLANDDWFNDLDDVTKNGIVKNINSLSNNIAKAQVDPDFETDDKAFQAYMEDGIDGLMDYYKANTMLKSHDLTANSHAGEDISAAIKEGDYEGAQRYAEAAQTFREADIPDAYDKYKYALEKVPRLKADSYAKMYKHIDSLGEGDKKSNGSISQDEIIAAMNKDKQHAEVYEKLFWTSDSYVPVLGEDGNYKKSKVSSGSGGVTTTGANGKEYAVKDQKAYQRGVQAYGSDYTEQVYAQQRSEIDTDGNGSIKKAELQAYIKKHPEEADKLWATYAHSNWKR